VIVNDMASLNIDSEIVKNANIVQTEEKLINLENGCTCCSLREDLMEEVAHLAASGKYDYCIIESTGVSEPMQVAEMFTFDLDGLMVPISKEAKELKELAILDTCVTVIDSLSFDKYFNSSDLASEEFSEMEKMDTRSIYNLFSE